MLVIKMLFLMRAGDSVFIILSLPPYSLPLQPATRRRAQEFREWALEPR